MTNYKKLVYCVEKRKGLRKEIKNLMNLLKDNNFSKKEKAIIEEDLDIMVGEYDSLTYKIIDLKKECDLYVIRKIY